jgi:NADH:ubiquinone reductase (H+-translocating)
VKINGLLAWAAHRGYHGMAIPTVERKVRVAGGWVNELVFGRDVTPLPDLENPTEAFYEAAGGGKAKAQAKS